MKKRIGFFVALMMVATLCISVLAACGDKEGEGGGDAAKYVGLFSYTRAVDGNVNHGYLNVKEDGSFYFSTDIGTAANLGTYEYNSDNTKITLTAELDQELSGTYNVVVNDDGNAVIQQVPWFNYEGTWFSDDFTYDEFSTPPTEQPIEIVTFYLANDADAKLTILTGNAYELLVSDPDIISSGSYTVTNSGSNYTYTLTDALGSGTTYTLTYTYTEADGYSNILLKGGEIAAAGLEWIYGKPVNAILSGTATSILGDETVTLTIYTDYTCALSYTVAAGANVTVATGSVVMDYATMSMSITLDDTAEAGPVSSISGSLDATTFMPTVVVTIAVEIPGLGDAGYTATLTMQF